MIGDLAAMAARQHMPSQRLRATGRQPVQHAHHPCRRMRVFPYIRRQELPQQLAQRQGWPGSFGFFGSFGSFGLIGSSGGRMSSGLTTCLSPVMVTCVYIAVVPTR